MRFSRDWLVCALLLTLPACASLLGLDESFEDQQDSASSAGSAGKSMTPDVGSGGTNRAGSSSGGSTNQAGQSEDGGAPDGPSAGGVGGNDPGGGSSGTGTVVSPLSRIVHGQTALAAGSASRNVALTEVVPERSFLVFGTSFDSTSSARTEISGQLSGSDSLTFARAAGSNAPNVPIDYFVAEFGSGVHVQRGSVTLEEAKTRVTLKSAAPLDRSFPMVTFRNAGSVYGLDDHVRAKLTSPTELSLEMYQAFGDGVVEWQVVSFDGAHVQAGDLSFGSSALQAKGELEAAVKPDATWLIFSYQVANITDSAADLMLRGHVEANQVVIDRAASGASATITYYAISFDNGSSVQSGDLAVAAQSQSAEAPLGALDVTRSLAVASGNYLRSGSTSYATANNPGYSSFRFSFTDSELTATRGAAAATGAATVGWNVIQFR